MSIYEKAVEALEKFDQFKSLAEGIQKFVDADNALDDVIAKGHIFPIFIHVIRQKATRGPAMS